MEWSPHDLERLRKQAAAGRTAAQMAAQLGRTRNAIAGKIFRDKIPWDLSARKELRRKRMQRFNARKQRLRAQRVQPRVSDITSPPPVTIATVVKRPRGGVRIRDLRSHHCRYGFGDPQTKGFRFCGEQRADNAPYCAYHCSICYQPLR